VTVPGLIDGDSINPGAKARLPAKPVNGGKDAKKDFLRKIERFFTIAEQVGGQLDDHPMVLGHELGAGRLVVGGTALHKRRFAAIDVEPADDTCLLLH
jgi:hypothetical protein